MKTALFTGSFDPITKGHLDLILRASKIFKKVIVAVGINSTKKYTFDQSKRVSMLKHEISRSFLGNVEVIEMPFGKMSFDLAYEHDAVLVKGVRVNADFDYEKLMSDIASVHNLNIDTMIFPCSQKTSHISSTAAKEVCKLNGNTEDFLTLSVKSELERVNGQYRLGITGTIASGKSTFVAELERRFPDKIVNVDLDKIANEILFERQEPLYVNLRKSLAEDFSIQEWNKKTLASVIFSNENDRKHLDRMLRPAIYTRIRESLVGKKGLILFNSALLVEASMLDAVNNDVFVIGVSKETQIKRLISRGHSEENSLKRIKSQLSTNEKINLISNKISIDGHGYLGYIDSEQDIGYCVDSFIKNLPKEHREFLKS